MKLMYLLAISLVVVSCGTGRGQAEDTATADGPRGAEEQVSAGAEESGASGSDGDQPAVGAGGFEPPELPAQFQGQEPPGRAGSEFTTDFSRATVSYDQVMSGGPPKDGIPSIDDPGFVDVGEADEWITPKESVLVVTAGAEDSEATHIYPVQILMWHEIVNDTVSGQPVSVTYCPLCNTGIAFDRRFDGRTLDFGTTGRLRYSNLIMYDRQTETWWQQATGKGIAGVYAGARLEMVPMLMVSWEDAKSEYPDARVLSRDTGYGRSYGTNPYAGYDTASRPFLYEGPTDDEFSPMTRVVTVFNDEASEAFPYPKLREDRAVNARIGNDSIAVLWHPGTASPLDAREVSEGRDVGTANAFFARANGRDLSFAVDGGEIVDEQTESTWDPTGRATSGPLEGHQLDPVTTSQHFWFSWTAFEGESDS